MRNSLVAQPDEPFQDLILAPLPWLPPLLKGSAVGKLMSHELRSLLVRSILTMHLGGVKPLRLRK